MAIRSSTTTSPLGCGGKRRRLSELLGKEPHGGEANDGQDGMSVRILASSRRGENFGGWPLPAAHVTERPPRGTRLNARQTKTLLPGGGSWSKFMASAKLEIIRHGAARASVPAERRLCTDMQRPLRSHATKISGGTSRRRRKASIQLSVGNEAVNYPRGDAEARRASDGL